MNEVESWGIFYSSIFNCNRVGDAVSQSMNSVPAELELYVDAFAARLQAVARGRAARVLYWLELVARDENAVTLQRVSEEHQCT